MATTTSIAGGMESAATALHERAANLPGGEKVAHAAHTAADALQTSADYLRDRDLRAMASDVREIAMRHPGATLVAAGLLGFLLARSLSRH